MLPAMRRERKGDKRKKKKFIQGVLGWQHAGKGQNPERKDFNRGNPLRKKGGAIFRASFLRAIDKGGG